MRLVGLTVLLWGALSACGEATHTPVHDAASCYACDEFGEENFTGRRGDGKIQNEICSEQKSSSGLPASPSSCDLSSPPSRFATTRIGDGGEAEGGGRPARARKVDMGFHHASFQDAARLLADAGRFAIVIEDVTATEVDARLRDVEPYEALVLLAQARGLEVDYDNGVVVVTRRSATASRTPSDSPP